MIKRTIQYISGALNLSPYVLLNVRNGLRSQVDVKDNT
jgi:hypothetical protein